MSVDYEARAKAESACRAIDELYGLVGGVASDIASVKRSQRDTKLIVGAIVALGTCAIGALTQVQVARITALSVQHASIAAR